MAKVKSVEKNNSEKFSPANAKVAGALLFECYVIFQRRKRVFC